MRSQNDVVKKTGMKMIDLKKYADKAIERTIKETRQCVAEITEELSPIKDAVKEFKNLEKEVTRQFNAHSTRAERVTQEATKCKEVVERYKGEIEDLSLTSSIEELKANNTMLKERVEQFNPYVKCATEHASTMQHLEATVEASRSELKNLAENVAAEGSNKMTDEQLIANAQRASKLLKTRPLSEPPPRSRGGLKLNTATTHKHEDDMTKWHNLLATVQQNKNHESELMAPILFHDSSACLD